MSARAFQRERSRDPIRAFLRFTTSRVLGVGPVVPTASGRARPVGAASVPARVSTSEAEARFPDAARAVLPCDVTPSGRALTAAAARKEREKNNASVRGCPGARLPAAPAAGSRGEREDPQAGHTGWLRLPDGAVRHCCYRALIVKKRGSSRRRSTSSRSSHSDDESAIIARGEIRFLR